MIRAETYKKYKAKDGHMAYKAEFIERGLYDQLMIHGTPENNLLSHRYRKIQAIPCGKCTECKLSYAQDWAARCMLEIPYHPKDSCWFLTITYNDESLRTHETVNEETGEVITGISLYKKDIQNFWKKVRNHYPDSKIMYIDCGEYGTHTRRPHYHAIVFGLKLNTKDFTLYKLNDMGDPMWQSEEFNKCWAEYDQKTKTYRSKGYIVIARVTLESAEYVARYGLKSSIEQTPKNWYAAQGKIPEFTTKSQGIGKKYFLEHWQDIYKTDSIPVMKKGRLLKPPRSYDEMLKKMDQNLYEKIKTKREKEMLSSIRSGYYKTNMTEEERREIQKEYKKGKIHNLRKEI